MTDPVKKAVERGKRITFLREESKMSKREFARTLGISPAYVVYLENGMKGNGSLFEPSEMMLQSICHKFGCSYQWLTEGIGSAHSSLRQRLIAQLLSTPDELLPEIKKFLDKISRG